MNLLNGQLVKILFRNGTSIEGFIDKWSDESSEYILKSIDGENIFIIQDPVNDIMIVRVKLDSPQKNNEIEPTKQISQLQKIPLQLPLDMDLRTKTLTQLRTKAIEEEKKVISEKLKDHSITQNIPVNYSLPSFIKGHK